MAGNDPYEAFDNFRTPLQKALTCVHKAAHMWVLVGSNGYRPGQDHALAPNDGEPVPLTSPQTLSLTCQFNYRVEEAEGERGPWKVRTTAYFHALEDEDGQEILTYHWHPEQGSAYNFPHLHIGVGIGASLGEVHKYHIPTGRVALEDVLRLAIIEFGVEPQRPDWLEILGKTQTDYETWRTWHGSGPSIHSPAE